MPLKNICWLYQNVMLPKSPTGHACTYFPPWFLVSVLSIRIISALIARTAVRIDLTAVYPVSGRQMIETGFMPDTTRPTIWMNVILYVMSNNTFQPCNNGRK